MKHKYVKLEHLPAYLKSMDFPKFSSYAAYQLKNLLQSILERNFNTFSEGGLTLEMTKDIIVDETDEILFLYLLARYNNNFDTFKEEIANKYIKAAKSMYENIFKLLEEFWENDDYDGTTGRLGFNEQDISYFSYEIIREFSLEFYKIEEEGL